MTSERYYEHYLARLRDSIARGPAAAQVLPVLDLFEGLPPAVRFGMVQQLERVLRDVDPASVDWVAGKGLVQQALAASGQDAEAFGRRLRTIAGVA